MIWLSWFLVPVSLVFAQGLDLVRLDGASAELTENSDSRCADGGIRVIQEKGLIDWRLGPLLRFEFRPKGIPREVSERVDGCLFHRKTVGTATRIQVTSTYKECPKASDQREYREVLELSEGKLVYERQYQGKEGDALVRARSYRCEYRLNRNN